jgi:predicted metal-dependent phosphoesterase TrpH
MTASGSGFKLDLHNHTFFSADGLMTPAQLLEAAKDRGIDFLAVTDHNTVQGALQALALSQADLSLPRVIPGVEVRTAAGEIIGLYVQEEIPRGLSLAETAALIRQQGGLVYLPHPYDVFRRGAVAPAERGHAAALADMVEVVNGRSLGPRAGRKAGRLAGAQQRPGGAGSDAHRKGEVGRVHILVGECPTRDTLVAAVAGGTIAHRLDWRQYTMNWGRQALAPVTRLYRRVTGDLELVGR